MRLDGVDSEVMFSRAGEATVLACLLFMEHSLPSSSSSLAAYDFYAATSCSNKTPFRNIPAERTESEAEPRVGVELKK